ncbi:MAG: hypothetical protein A3D21_00310 [Nitrospirae bacterium RIFCSPHIGHO2_02_FULL_42_12]|nr:MAG: hypothetical protein A3D21_00310 [Nitrospirae bacterium RIFCSPHIGHO2_02_FULL_42_12]
MKVKYIKWIAFAIATLLALFTIFGIPRLNRDIPRIPGNEDHRRITKISECIQCHSEQGGDPLPEDHAARTQCHLCHTIQDKIIR